MKSAVWLLLVWIYPVFSAVLPRKPENVDHFNDLKSAMINEMIVKELSENECRVGVPGGGLQELYFHLNTSAITVHIQDPGIHAPPCVKVENVTNDVFASRMDLALAFPALHITGTVAFLQLTSLTRHPFSLELENVRGAGMCFTRWSETGFEVKQCDIRFQKGSVRMTSPSSGFPMEKTAFASASIDRMWRAVTTTLNANVAGGFNRFLRDVNVMKYLRDPEMFQKYRNYVIESTESANEFVDGIMDAVRKTIREKYGDSFAIPDIREGFRRKVVLVTWRGSFTADHGTVHGLATVSRVGDTAFATDNASQTHFFGNLSFQRLDLHYDRYKAEFMSFGPTGTLNTRLQPIRLHIHPYVNFETGRIYLEDFEIEEVGELSVQVTGLGTVLNWVLSKITTWVVGLTRDRILDDLQNKYDEYIKSVLSGYTIRDITSGAAFDRP